MTAERYSSRFEPRPEFMVTLGLLPPYAEEDVRMAYHEKAKRAHPDRGGSVEEFRRLQEAFEQATEYAKFRASRRLWLATQVERYTEHEQVVAEINRRGGAVEIEHIDWLKRSIGEDFAQLTDRLRAIRLRDAANPDEFLDMLRRHPRALGYLVSLDLAGCRLSDRGLLLLPPLELLKRLNLAETPITANGLKLVQSLPRLEWLNLAGTAVGWWSRWRLKRSHPKLTIITDGRG